MKRVIYLQDSLNRRKYVLKTEYEGHGIYEEVCPTGWRVHQSWAIVRDKDNFTIMIQSYNSMCYEELLDAIDWYNDADVHKYGINVVATKESVENNYWVAHSSGKEI